MVDVIFNLLGLDSGSINLDPNVVFVTCSLLVSYCVCYFLNFFQVLMERLTAKRGR